MSTGTRTDPYLDYRFQVEIDSIVVGGFSEVRGLEATLDTEEYEEGGVNSHAHTLPAGFSYPNVVLERGLTDSTVLWDWIGNATHGTIERRNGRVLLLDRTGRLAWGWEFRDAYPVQWSGPELRADRASVAVETLELAHDGIARMDGVPG